MSDKFYRYFVLITLSLILGVQLLLGYTLLQAHSFLNETARGMNLFDFGKKPTEKRKSVFSD